MTYFEILLSILIRIKLQVCFTARVSGQEPIGFWPAGDDATDRRIGYVRRSSGVLSIPEP